MATQAHRVPIEPQSVDAPLTQSAIFLTLSVGDGDAAVSTVRTALAGMSGLVKNTAIRDLGAAFACTVG